jgi:putative SOS response-associated peptidase YedK
MSGRFARTSSRDALAAEYGVEHFVNVDLAPRYNIAPNLYVETIVNDGAETVATTALFREAFQRRRCLVVADGSGL